MAAFAVAVAAGLAACSIVPAPAVDPVNYDFGLASVQAGKAMFRPAILIPDVVAPVWMDSPAIHYRLSYRDAARPQAYSGSRWVMPPAILITNRLRQKAAAATAGGVVVPADGIRAAYTLRLEIEEFSQVFDSAKTSHADIRVRASLLGSRALLAQHTFSVAVPSVSPDAGGGVVALTTASEQVIDQVIGWAAGEINRVRHD